MSCGCGNCECEALRERIAALEAENAELTVHVTMLVTLDEQRREAEKAFSRHLVAVRGKTGGTE